MGGIGNVCVFVGKEGKRERGVKRSNSFALLVLFLFFFLPALVVSAGCGCCGIVVAVVVVPGAPKPNSPCGGNGDSHHSTPHSERRSMCAYHIILLFMVLLAIFSLRFFSHFFAL